MTHHRQPVCRCGTGIWCRAKYTSSEWDQWPRALPVGEFFGSRARGQTRCQPQQFLSIVRLKLGDASLVDRTNMNGHVVQLDAVGPDRTAMVTARSSIPSANCSTRKSPARIAINNRQLHGHRNSRVQKSTGIVMIKNEVLGVRELDTSPRRCEVKGRWTHFSTDDLIV